jgi:hypothetical protein
MEYQLFAGGAVDRREFCLTSAAAAISGAAIGVAGLAAARQLDPGTLGTSSSSIQPYKFIYDRRYPIGRAFGAAAEHAGAAAGVVDIGGDITELWSRDLRRRWSAGGGAIAGMTTARTLFCLEQLARDHWMRVVIRAEHAVSEGQEIAHRVTAAEQMIVPLRSALAATDWPARMPAALVACGGAEGASRTTRVIGSTRGLDWAMRDEQLVSFVIA